MKISQPDPPTKPGARLRWRGPPQPRLPAHGLNYFTVGLRVPLGFRASKSCVQVLCGPNLLPLFLLSVLSDNSPCSLVTIKGERGFVHHHLFYHPLDILLLHTHDPPAHIYLFLSLERLHLGSVLSAQSRHGFSIYLDKLSKRITAQIFDSRTSFGSNTVHVTLQQKRRKLPDLKTKVL